MTAADRFNDAFLTLSLYAFVGVVVVGLCVLAVHKLTRPADTKSR